LIQKDAWWGLINYSKLIFFGWLRKTQLVSHFFSFIGDFPTRYVDFPAKCIAGEYHASLAVDVCCTSHLALTRHAEVFREHLHISTSPLPFRVIVPFCRKHSRSVPFQHLRTSCLALHPHGGRSDFAKMSAVIPIPSPAHLNFRFWQANGDGSIPIDTFLVGWTSIYQLFWGSLGTRVLTHPQITI
jgi:hypothetical protein